MFRRLLAAVLALLLTLSWPAGPASGADGAFGAPSAEDQYRAAATVLARYGLIQGDERGLRFSDSLTRGEMAKLLVLALGMERQVKSAAGRRDFADTRGHWAELYIAVGKQLGILQGYPDGRFQPEQRVNYAETLAAFARLVGLEAGPEPWPYTYVEPARAAGIIPAGMDLPADLRFSAPRGDVFLLFKRTLADVTNISGQNLLQRYLDRVPPRLTLDPHPAETQSARLIVTGTAEDAAQVRIGGEPVSLSYGFFQHEVPLRLGPNTIRAQAVDDAGNVKEAVARVTRVPGAAAALELTGPAEVAVGRLAQYRLVIRDRDGAELPDRTGLEARVIPDLGKFDPVTGRFDAGTRAGRAAIVVTAGGAQGSLSVTIGPGPLDRIEVTPAEISLVPEESAVFSAAGFDSYGNSVPLSGVAWSTGTGSITAGGLYTAPAGTGAAGATITATTGGKTGTAAVRPLNYKVSAVSLSKPAVFLLVANGQAQASLTAVVQDGAGNAVKDYQGVVQVTSSAPGVAMPVQTEARVVDGVAVIPLRAGAAAGTAVITVKTNLGITGTLEVPVERQILQTIRLAGTALASSDGTPMGEVEAVALDQQGYPLLAPLSQTLLVTLSINAQGGSAIFASTADKTTFDLIMGSLDPRTGDVRSRTQVRITNPTSGTVVVEGTQVRPEAFSYVKVGMTAIASGPLGTPAQVRIEPVPETITGRTRTVSAYVVDGAGRRVSSLGSYGVSLRDQNGATWTSSPGAMAGQLIFDVTQQRAGTYTYTATLLPGGHSVSVTTTVVPDLVAAIVVKPLVLQANAAQGTELVAELVDAFGQRVTTGTYAVTLKQRLPVTGATRGFPDQTVASAGGLARVTVYPGSVLAVDIFDVSVPGPVAAGQAPPPDIAQAVTVETRGAPQRLRLSYPAGASGTAGMPVKLEAEVVDEAGDVAAYESGRAVTLTFRSSATQQETPYTAATVEGVASFTVTRTDADTFAVKAESGALLKALSAGYGGVAQDVTVQAGLATRLRVTPDITTLKSDGGVSYTWVTVDLLDAQGNVSANPTGQPVLVTLSGWAADGSTGYMTANDSQGGFKTVRRTVTVFPGAFASAPVKFFSGASTGSATLTASTPDGGSASAVIISTAIGSVASLAAGPLQVAVAEPYSNMDSSISGQTVEVTALDAGGRRVTGFGAAGEMITLTTAGDAAVVAVYNWTAGAWLTLDSVPGNGLGDYQATGLAPADRGRALFRVRARSAGTKVYLLGYAGNAQALNITGEFRGESPEYLTVQAARRTVTGGGEQVAIEARVRDRYGNPLSGVTGPVQFALSAGGSGGMLLNTTAELVGGIATVYFQSALQVPASAQVTVQAWTTGLSREDGSSLNPGGSQAQPAADTFTVDATPRLVAVQVQGVGGAGGGADGLATPEDVLRFTFSEPVSGETVATGLTAGSSVSHAGLGAILFDSRNATILFEGVSGLGACRLKAGAVSITNSYRIQTVELDPGGTVVSVTLGARDNGTQDSAVLIGPGDTVDATLPGTVRDAGGSGAHGLYPGIPLSGSF